MSYRDMRRSVSITPWITRSPARTRLGRFGCSAFRKSFPLTAMKVRITLWFHQRGEPRPYPEA